ncbi:MAG: type II secretion system protein [Candidatus Gastranaerophilaceae bacterium]
MKKFGFNLAEVLIALGIIGVIAAYTIPTLLHNTQNQELKAQFTKSYSTLNQAILQMQANGYDSEDPKYLVWLTNDYVLDMKQFLNALKEVSVYSDNYNYISNLKDYNGNVENPLSTSAQTFKNGKSIILNNGLIFHSYRNSGASWINVDTNGYKKPNRWGYDIFTFYILNNRLRVEETNSACTA